MKPYDYEANKHKLVDSTGKRLTTGLFEELIDDRTTVVPVFKLSEWRKVYVEVADPTDYNAAAVLIGNWDHWLLLADNPAFRCHLDTWRKEVEVKLRSMAILELVKQSRTPKGTQAARWLAERGWGKRDMRKKGAKEEEEQANAEVAGRVKDDAKRLGLRAVK